MKGFCRHLQNGLVALPDHFSSLVNLCVLDAHANPFPCLPEVGSRLGDSSMSGVACCLHALTASSQLMVFSLPRLHSATLVMLAFSGKNYCIQYKIGQACIARWPMPQRRTPQMMSAPLGSPAQLW